MQKIKPLSLLEDWLGQVMSPVVEQVSVSTKKTNNFGSTGLDIVLKPVLVEKPPVLTIKNLTIAGLEDTMVAELLEHPVGKQYISSYEVFDTGLTPKDIDTLENDNPVKSDYGCKAYQYFTYPQGNSLLFYFHYFTIKTSGFIFTPEVITEYLFFRAKNMQKKLLLVYSNNVEEVNMEQEYSRQYLWFLLNVLFQVAEVQKPKENQ